MEQKKVEQAGDVTGWDKTKEVLYRIGIVLKAVGKWIFRLRGLLMAIPVGVAAVMLAIRNMAKLPEEVGINLLANGQYEYLVDRGIAVVAPLFVTAICILMIFFSRRTIYPWIISIFSLVLPYLIWITNVFPA